MPKNVGYKTRNNPKKKDKALAKKIARKQLVLEKRSK